MKCLMMVEKVQLNELILSLGLRFLCQCQTNYFRDDNCPEEYDEKSEDEAFKTSCILYRNGGEGRSMMKLSYRRMECESTNHIKQKDKLGGGRLGCSGS